jgi:type III secretory pathway component EscU
LRVRTEVLHAYRVVEGSKFIHSVISKLKRNFLKSWILDLVFEMLHSGDSDSMHYFRTACAIKMEKIHKTVLDVFISSLIVAQLFASLFGIYRGLGKCDAATKH